MLKSAPRQWITMSDKLNRYSLIIFLTVAVIGSGCTSDSEKTQKEEMGQQINQTQQKMGKQITCSNVHLDIVAATASNAVILNRGSTSTGEIEVTWKLENGKTETKKVSIQVGKQKTVTNNLTGKLREVVAESVKCEDRKDIYP